MNPRMMWNNPNTPLIVWLTLLMSMLLACQAAAQTLEGIAVLPADTFAPGPTSGQFITATNGRIPPFVGKQPVQGVSAVLRSVEGDFLVMEDNGFGAKGNSADFVLRVYQVQPNYKTKARGTGTVNIKSFITLHDPDQKINFPIVADSVFYPGSVLPVDSAIRSQRLLTGGDLDIESMRQSQDGTFWFGDEFGPFLLHTDATGKVLEAPFALPNVQSPQNPFLGAGTPNLPSSRGFEGMALSPDSKTLYPLLEGPLVGDPDQRRLIINQFDLAARQYTGRQWFYRLEATTQSGQAIGDFTAISKDRFLVIERDGGQGVSARFKKIFLVDLRDVDSQGFLSKQEVADLLNISDPDNLGGTGTGVFTFPFVTIESVIPLSANKLAVINDNNYPFSSGRPPGQPDSNEFIIIRLDQPLPRF